MIVQIYEIQTPDEAEVMISLGVDHVGSVLISDAQWQDADLQSTVRLVRSCGRKSSLIPLFGHADTISKAIEYYQPDIVHFCEALPQTLKDLKAFDPILTLQKTIRVRFPQLEIMRSIPICASGHNHIVPSLEYANLFEPYSDWFLTDTFLDNGNIDAAQDQPVPGYVGITGQICDWDMARKLVRQSRIPVILAGGIGPDNVEFGISHVSPQGVDSCTLTNVMTPDGQARRFQKDPEKVRKMIRNTRKAYSDKKRRPTS